MIISVHLPKTAGMSFLGSLQTHFGNNLKEDYHDIPINKGPEQRNREAIESSLRNVSADFTNIQCIHGHFMPVKYLLMATGKPVHFVTWMRHPVERVISHYHFWKRRSSLPSHPPLHKRVLEENWSLERFCLSEEIKDLYHSFLWGFPIDNFSFIGITEHYDEDFKYFEEHFIGKHMEIKKENMGENEGKKYDIDPVFRKEIEIHHEKDIRLYEHVLRIRQTRLSIQQ